MCALIATFAVETTDVSTSARPYRKLSAARSLYPLSFFATIGDKRRAQGSVVEAPQNVKRKYIYHTLTTS